MADIAGTTTTATALIRPATPTDLTDISDLLSRSNLPIEGVAESLRWFVVAVSEERVVGVAGVEQCGDYGLLRSAAVDPDWRSRGVGRAMVEQLISDSQARGLRALYLLTTTAAKYFPNFGFRETTRDTVPTEVKMTAEFRDICPSSATVMSLELPRPRTPDKS